MRLRILSDLHLEFSSFRLPPAEADVVILAGDIHLGRQGRQWARNCFPNTPVIYVMGNHEFYRHSLPGLTETLRRETTGTDFHLLEEEAVELGGITFLGCTLWSDFNLTFNPEVAMKEAEEMMSDYSIIRVSPSNRVLRARDTAAFHAKSCAWLRRALAQCDPVRTVVITHHAPSSRSEAPYHANSPLRPAFATALDALVESCAVPLWIHGHTHYNVDYTLGSTRVLTNQRGYPDQPCARFDPALVVEV